MILERCFNRKRNKVVNYQHHHQQRNTRIKGNCCLLGQLPEEIWVEILGKLPLKGLCVCKSVSKTWHSHVSYILSFHKDFETSPCSLLFTVTRYELEEDIGDYNKYDFSLGYMPLIGGDRTITKWSIDDATANTASTRITSQGLLLENITLDFSHLMLDRRNFILRTMHRGLFLVGITDSVDLHVYNPATAQVFILPSSPNMLETTLPVENVLDATIINLSDCLLSTQSNFRVIRFNKEFGFGKAEIYSSKKNQWFHSVFHSDDFILSDWLVHNSVYVGNTLFFMTNKTYVLGAKFLSDEHEQVSPFILPLPKSVPIRHTRTLYASQGCLYLGYNMYPNLYIWKHNVSSVDPATADAWIPQLIFDHNTTPLCCPVALRFLTHFVSNGPCPMVIHPMEPIVFFFAVPSIFALHLLNDTVEKIAELADKEDFLLSFVHMYSPCFASLTTALR